MEALQDILNIIESMGIIIASIFTVYAINTWKKETKWKKKFELSEDVLSAVYKVRDNFNFIRSPFRFGEEGNSRQIIIDESEVETKIRNAGYIPFERFERRKESFYNLYALKYKMMAVYGKEAGVPFDKIKGELNSIFNAADRLTQLELSNLTYSKEDDHDKRLKYETIIWSEFDDTFNQNLDLIVNEFEQFFKESRN
jgi:hypothetical protein